MQTCRKNRTRVRWLRRAALLLAVLIPLAVWYGDHQLRQAALNQAKARAAAAASSLLHQAAEDALGSLPCDSLIRVTRDADGHVRLIETDTLRLNQLTTAVNRLAQQRLAALTEQPLCLTLGTALGLTVLSGVGPALAIDIKPYGTVSASLSSAFTSAGVNQTRHTITLHLTCTVMLTLGSASTSVAAVTDLAVAENIIVGEVPQTLLNDQGRLNLTP